MWKSPKNLILWAIMFKSTLLRSDSTDHSTKIKKSNSSVDKIWSMQLNFSLFIWWVDWWKHHVAPLAAIGTLSSLICDCCLFNYLLLDNQCRVFCQKRKMNLFTLLERPWLLSKVNALLLLSWVRVMAFRYAPSRGNLCFSSCLNFPFQW